MAGGFGLKFRGWRTLLPEDASGRINMNQLRTAVHDFHRNVDNYGGMNPTPWRGSGIEGLRNQTAYRDELNAKMKAVAVKNELIDKAERGDKKAIKALKDIAAKEKNLMLLRRQYQIPNITTKSLMR